MALSLIPGSVLPAPGQCFSCGSIGIDMLDTGKNEAYYGAIMICTQCFVEAALRIPELGLVSTAYHEMVVGNLRDQMGMVDNIGPTLDRLRRDLDSAMDNASSNFREHHPDSLASIEVPSRVVTSEELTERDGEEDQQYFFSIAELLRTS